jgi:hypothetical protein
VRERISLVPQVCVCVCVSVCLHVSLCISVCASVCVTFVHMCGSVSVYVSLGTSVFSIAKGLCFWVAHLESHHMQEGARSWAAVCALLDC